MKLNSVLLFLLIACNAFLHVNIIWEYTVTSDFIQSASSTSTAVACVQLNTNTFVEMLFVKGSAICAFPGSRGQPVP